MKISQATRILEILDNAKGQWVKGRYFNDTMKISQYHSRIHKLQAEGYKIIASDFVDKFGFKSYKLEVSGNTAHPKVKPVMHNKNNELEELFKSTPKPLKPYYEYNK